MRVFRHFPFFFFPQRAFLSSKFSTIFHLIQKYIQSAIWCATSKFDICQRMNGIVWQTLSNRKLKQTQSEFGIAAPSSWDDRSWEILDGQRQFTDHFSFNKHLCRRSSYRTSNADERYAASVSSFCFCFFGCSHPQNWNWGISCFNFHSLERLCSVVEYLWSSFK